MRDADHGHRPSETFVVSLGRRVEPEAVVYTYEVHDAPVMIAGPVRSRSFRQIVPRAVMLTVREGHVLAVVTGPKIQGNGESYAVASSLAIEHAPAWLQPLIREHLSTSPAQAPSSAGIES